MNRTSTTEPSETPPPRVAGWRRWWVRVLAGLALVLAGTVLALRTEWGATHAVRFALDRLDLFEGARVEVGRAGGTVFTRLALYDVRLVREDGTPLVHVDTLAARYRLWPLLRKELRLDSVAVVRPVVTMRQEADGSWDLVNALPLDTTAADTAAGGFRIRLDAATLRSGRAEARFFAPDRDSLLRVEDLALRLRDVRLAGTTAFTLDTLTARFIPPGSHHEARVRLGAEVKDGRLAVAGFELTSDASRVMAHGTLPWPGATTADSVAFVLSARPLAFRDLAPFVPTLDPNGSVVAEARAGGTMRLTDLDLDARFSGGGRVTVRGALTPDLAAAPVVRLEAAIRRLDLRSFAAGDTLGLLNADVSVDLAGPALAGLGGTVRAVLFGSRLAGERLARTTLTARFDGGRAALDLTSGARGASLTASGTVRPFDETPAYDLTADVRGLDLGRLLDDPAQSSDLGATLHVAGTGFDPATADLTADLTVLPSPINAARLDSGRVDVRLAGGRLTFDGRLVFPGARLSAAGTATLGDEPAYEIRDGRVERLPYMALLGDTTRSALSGTFTLTGRGADPETLALTATARLHDGFYDGYLLDAADLHAALEAGALTFDLDASLGGGDVRLAGRMRPFDEVPTLTLTEGVFHGLDLAAFTPFEALATDLNGRLALAVRGFDPAGLSLDARLDLAASCVNAQPLRRGRLTVNGTGGALGYALDLVLPDGRMRFDGDVRMRGETLSYSAKRGLFFGFDAGAWLGTEAFRTALNGALTFEARGTDPATMLLDARLTFDPARPSRFNDETLTGGGFSASFDGGKMRLEADLAFAEGRAAFDAEGRFLDHRPAYTAHGAFDRVDLAALAGLDSTRAALTFDFDVTGEGLDPADMRLDGRFHADGTRYESLTLDRADAAFHLEDGLLRVDSLAVRSNVAGLSGKGPVALFDARGAHASDFRFEADLFALAPVGEILDVGRLRLGDGRVTGALKGRPGALRFDVDVNLNSLVMGEMRVARVKTRLLGAFAKDRTVAEAEARADLRFLSFPNFTVERTGLLAEYRPDSLGFEIDTRLDRRRDGYLGGRVAFAPDGERLTLDSLRLRLDADRWRLLQPAVVERRGRRYEVRNLLLFSESGAAGDGGVNQQIALDGEIDLDGEQSLILTIEQFRLDAVADLLGYDGLGGMLDGWLTLGGAVSAPVAEGSLEFDLSLSGQAVGDMAMTLSYEDLALSLDALLTDDRGSELRFGGTLPLDLRLTARADEAAGFRVDAERAAPESAVDFKIRTTDFSIGWLMPFMDRTLVDRLEGRLTADVDVRGTVDAPLLSGTATLEDGRIGLPQLGRPRHSLVFTGVEVETVLEDNRVRVNHLQVRSGGGTMIGMGTVRLSELTLGAFDLTMSAEDFLAIDTRVYHAVTAADLTLRGTTRSPILSGDVELVSADVFLTEELTSEEFEAVALSERDQQILEQRFGVRLTEADTTTFDFYEALTITDLTVRLERDSWLRSKKNPTMDIQFSGDLDVQKQPNADPLVFGTIEVIPDRSRIIQFGKRFEIERGTLTFNGPPTDPFMDIKAVYVVKARQSTGDEVTISLTLKGQPEALDFSLGSDPQMEFADIVSYLAFGRPASEALQLGSTAGGGNGSLLDPAAGVAVGQLASLIENLAGAGLGLDVVEIEQNGLEGATLTAGKYVSPRLYVAVSQPITFRRTEAGVVEENPTQVVIEYEVIDRLLLRLLRRGSIIRINVKWEYAF
ncbi:translocation/assembly module TamB domain-containing protein [Rhodocaloribacter sp.]